MSDFNCIPISCVDNALLLPLMLEEERAWFADLEWDYSGIREILLSFARQKLLPGYVAFQGGNAVGYTYFLVNQAKGIIGSLYASEIGGSQETIDQLVRLAATSLKEKEKVNRIEAQIMPFHSQDLTSPFMRNGFTFHERSYLRLDLKSCTVAPGRLRAGKIIPWSSLYLDSAAEMNMLSYRGQSDAQICEDYRTIAGCESYLRSLVENPGCGVLMQEASFMALDAQGRTIGLILCSRISDGAAMIPQIAVHPLHQGLGVGNTLMNTTLSRLKKLGFHSVALTVTKGNTRAYSWYQRVGFRHLKDFGAYVWER